MIERRIKELSIALEALSRINGYAATVHSDHVSDLLTKAIQEAKEYYNKPLDIPPTAPANADNDIPF